MSDSDQPTIIHEWKVDGPKKERIGIAADGSVYLFVEAWDDEEPAYWSPLEEIYPARITIGIEMVRLVKALSSRNQ